MAKKSVQRSQITAMLASIEAQMAQIYGNTYAEVMRLSRIRKAIEEGEEFEFDGNKAAAMQVEGVLRTLAAQTTMLIKQGDKAAWEAGEKNADNTLGAIFGKTKDGKATLEELTQRAREEARGRGADANGFYHRQEGGMNISERVWKVTEQSKRDIELLIQNGVKQGKTADEISRDIRPFLQNPTAQFRRVRNKKTGELELSKAAKEYHAGTGVYRSAYKNAMRLARTEVNMAYRRAEWESYQSNPLVTGIRIGLSNNHTTKNSKGQTVPLTDICDELAGDYPKTFQWTGWHPQCRCRMTPITVSQDDFKERMKALFSGALDDWKPDTTVTAPPKEFGAWVKANLGRLQNAKSMPYFIRDNFVAGNPTGKLAPAIASLETEVQKQKKSKEEIAELKKQLDGIKQETSFFGIDTSVADELVATGDATQLKQENAALTAKVADGQKTWDAFVNAERAEINDIFGKQAPEIKNEAADILSDLIDDIKSAKESGKFGATMEDAMANIRIEIDRKKVELEEMKKQKMKQLSMEKYGKNILQIMSGISDVDTKPLQQAIDAEDYNAIEAEAKKLKETGKKILGLKNIINPMDVAKNFSMADAIGTDKAVAGEIEKWKEKYATDKYIKNKYATEQDYIKSKLEWQINEWYGSGNYDEKSKKHATWQVAEAAYKKKLQEIEDDIAWKDIKAKHKAMGTFYANTGSPIFINLYNKLEIVLDEKKELSKAKMLLSQLNYKKHQLERAQAKRDAKQSGVKPVKFGADAFSQERMDNAVWMLDSTSSRDKFYPYAVKQWKGATAEEKRACVQYTEGSGYITRFLRGIEGYLEYGGYQGKAEKDVKLITSYVSRCSFDFDCWVKRDEKADFATYQFGVDVDEICDNEMKIHELNEERNNIVNSRTKKSKDRLREIDEELKERESKARANSLVGLTGIDESIQSCGSNKSAWFSGTGGDNKKGKPRVCLNIYCPKGTQIAYADMFNYFTSDYESSHSHPWDGKTKYDEGESELFLQRGTKMKITKAEYSYAIDVIFIDVIVIAQNPRDFEIEYVEQDGGYRAKFK